MPPILPARRPSPRTSSVPPRMGSRPARAAAPEGRGENAGKLECRWQRDRLPKPIRCAPVATPRNELSAMLVIEHVDAFPPVDLDDARQFGPAQPSELDCGLLRLTSTDELFMSRCPFVRRALMKMGSGSASPTCVNHASASCSIAASPTGTCSLRSHPVEVRSAR